MSIALLFLHTVSANPHALFTDLLIRGCKAQTDHWTKHLSFYHIPKRVIGNLRNLCCTVIILKNSLSFAMVNRTNRWIIGSKTKIDLWTSLCFSFNFVFWPASNVYQTELELDQYLFQFSLLCTIYRHNPMGVGILLKFLPSTS